ncbi:Hypothetical predicted protein [Olea europaea subsp. europaea]|uniref:Uncharacterized protein n=1 Tax=Olea europaea subsp. europaea TaxID=158383 RepID=A0A8S0SHP1_OLEEU|nr:Hypothetical predicted protein [Olea europaea subsp. europaea]
MSLPADSLTAAREIRVIAVKWGSQTADQSGCRPAGALTSLPFINGMRLPSDCFCSAIKFRFLGESHDASPATGAHSVQAALAALQQIRATRDTFSAIFIPGPFEVGAVTARAARPANPVAS